MNSELFSKDSPTKTNNIPENQINNKINELVLPEEKKKKKTSNFFC